MVIPIGVDPASGKKTCIWFEDRYEFVEPNMVRDKIESLIKEYKSCLIAWDAPISFSKKSYSDRDIDKAARQWVKEHVSSGKISPKSVNALPFSGLSHWVISCESLGFPFGVEINGLNQYESCVFKADAKNTVVEVHPAVSMAFSWVDSGVNDKFPEYKGKDKENERKKIVSVLGYPEICIKSDDILDAYVAHKMASDFITGDALFPCNPMNGSYVLPKGESLGSFKDKYLSFL